MDKFGQLNPFKHCIQHASSQCLLVQQNILENEPQTAWIYKTQLLRSSYHQQASCHVRDTRSPSFPDSQSSLGLKRLALILLSNQIPHSRPYDRRSSLRKIWLCIYAKLYKEKSNSKKTASSFGPEVPRGVGVHRKTLGKAAEGCCIIFTQDFPKRCS